MNRENAIGTRRDERVRRELADHIFEELAARGLITSEEKNALKNRNNEKRQKCS
ncbi:MAG: hypothetical protein NC079_00935 [Clostridium sp.]|nr:hypothetical protein [Acetatifactor muris]MCM1526088.1 hypothetical protein [Bacteroides sp.]MCM1562153.1 hypothetical protein [Clostridium sp.]